MEHFEYQIDKCLLFHFYVANKINSKYVRSRKWNFFLNFILSKMLHFTFCFHIEKMQKRIKIESVIFKNLTYALINFYFLLYDFKKNEVSTFHLDCKKIPRSSKYLLKKISTISNNYLSTLSNFYVNHTA